MKNKMVFYFTNNHTKITSLLADYYSFNRTFNESVVACYAIGDLSNSPKTTLQQEAFIAFNLEDELKMNWEHYQEILNSIGRKSEKEREIPKYERISTGGTKTTHRIRIAATSKIVLGSSIQMLYTEMKKDNNIKDIRISLRITHKDPTKSVVDKEVFYIESRLYHLIKMMTQSRDYMRNGYIELTMKDKSIYEHIDILVLYAILSNGNIKFSMTDITLKERIYLCDNLYNRYRERDMLIDYSTLQNLLVKMDDSIPVDTGGLIFDLEGI